MLQIEADKIIQKIGSYQRVWSIPELLEAHNPFFGEPLAERTAALRQAVEMGMKLYDELSERARLYIDFWEKFDPQKIREQDLKYTAISNSTEYNIVTINELGLFYTDFSGGASVERGYVVEQLLSDFWFFGPLRPIPELGVRQELVNVLKKAFTHRECPASMAHFELFEYPEMPDPRLHWTEGDHYRTDEIRVGRDGIEISSSNWRDQIPQTGFLSFENFLNAPLNDHALFNPEIRAAIEVYLGRASRHSPVNPNEPAAPSPREKMEAAEALLKHPESEEGAEILISLLEYESEEVYWRNYVFNRFFKLRTNKRVQNFVVQCLQGDNETHFKKAVDVLTMWGVYGDNALMDRALLQSLNWEDACANDPDYRQAFEKVLPIIHQKNN